MKSGIYIYCNKINGKKYVGQSVDIEKRLNRHLWESNKENPILLAERAIKKYKIENFYIIKIQCPKRKLNEMEKHYIEFFNSLAPNGYNLESGGNSNYEVSEESKIKMSEAQKGENHPMYGKKLSEEHKMKLIKSRKGKKASEETIRKMSLAHKGKELSETNKRKISESLKGKKLSEETKDKMRKSKSEETKNKMSIAKKNYWNKNKSLIDIFDIEDCLVKTKRKGK